MKNLYTNSSSRNDFVINGLHVHGGSANRILVATAFFTNPDPIKKWSESGASVQIVVRLGFPTSPQALREIIDLELVHVRYITDTLFHPKLYIFDRDVALVGSSNLTRNGILRNQEINVAIPGDDPRCDELISVFLEYWSSAKVLDDAIIGVYERIYNQHGKQMAESSKQLDQEVRDRIGEVDVANFPRVSAKPRKPSQMETFIDAYREEYQGFVKAIESVARIYRESGVRRWSEDEYPFLLEVDRFIAWIRGNHAAGDKWLTAAATSSAEREKLILELIEEWEGGRWPDGVREAAPRWHREICASFATSETVEHADWDRMIEGLALIHSFLDRRRFFKGGHDTHVAEFKAANDLAQVRRTISYLLFGRGHHEERLCRVIFDPAYKLPQFGASAAQELLGRMNSAKIPVCNNRTLKSLHWLGFDVQPRGG